jgi:hypothetical protein
MSYRERFHHSDDYIDQAGDGLGWAPMVLGIAFVALLGLLLVLPLRPSGTASNNPQGESRHEAQAGPAPQNAALPKP